MKVLTISMNTLMVVMLLFLTILLGINQYLISSINVELMKIQRTDRENTESVVRQIYEEVIPKDGSQTDYGLTFSIDGMNALVNYYRSLELTDDEQERFIAIGTQPDTGCEYCCGIGDGPALSEDGRARCGCSHHLALIGLIKYLVQQGYGDEQILNEVQKWKAYFFPQGYLSEVLQQRGINPETVGLPAQRGGC